MFRPKVNTFGGLPIIYIKQSDIESNSFDYNLVEIGSVAKGSAELLGNYTSKTVSPGVNLFYNCEPILDLKANIITTKSKTNGTISTRNTFVITKPSTEFYFAFTFSILDTSKNSITNAIVADSNKKNAVGKPVTISHITDINGAVFAIKAEESWCSDWNFCIPILGT